MRDATEEERESLSRLELVRKINVLREWLVLQDAKRDDELLELAVEGAVEESGERLTGQVAQEMIPRECWEYGHVEEVEEEELI